MKKIIDMKDHMKILQKKYKKGASSNELIDEFIKVNKKLEKELKKGVTLILR